MSESEYAAGQDGHVVKPVSPEGPVPAAPELPEPPRRPRHANEHMHNYAEWVTYALALRAAYERGREKSIDDELEMSRMRVAYERVVKMMNYVGYCGEEFNVTLRDRAAAAESALAQANAALREVENEPPVWWQCHAEAIRRARESDAGN